MKQTKQTIIYEKVKPKSWVLGKGTWLIYNSAKDRANAPQFSFTDNELKKRVESLDFDKYNVIVFDEV